ncbi:hypothetical protein M5D96_013895 [Drosophila gunungcola]|uniref:Uncharacterized protein n=1 Tax=Drosophila gunungcola TaxID=103775 RepID=A0A9P9YAG6_9MUSC|nr:hypothetical protein M5D96_013895 [Drosophila gunungcola]
MVDQFGHASDAFDAFDAFDARLVHGSIEHCDSLVWRACIPVMELGIVSSEIGLNRVIKPPQTLTRRLIAPNSAGSLPSPLAIRRRSFIIH